MAGGSDDRAADRVAQAAGRVAGEVADRLAPLRAAGWRALGRGEGAVARAVRRANDALGRPLAPADELADRRAFARGYRDREPGASPASASAGARREAAPVLVYFMDKQRRDLPKITDILDSHGVPYQLASLEEDPAAHAAVRRDSRGLRLPLVFIAGDCVGGREQGGGEAGEAGAEDDDVAIGRVVEGHRHPTIADVSSPAHGGRAGRLVAIEREARAGAGGSRPRSVVAHGSWSERVGRRAGADRPLRRARRAHPAGPVALVPGAVRGRLHARAGGHAAA
jgi:hypothetical protein